MSSDKIRVLQVDDSAVVRGIISRILDGEQDIEVVATAPNGQIGVESYKRHMPDLVILDIEMPVMDGITALQEILKIDPDAKIVMCSTLTTHNAEITLKALGLGALDCIAKPTASGDMMGASVFKDILLRTVRTLGCLRSSRPEAVRAAAPLPQISDEVRERLRARLDEHKENRDKATVAPVSYLPDEANAVLRTYQPLARGQKIELLAIGSSTGGPQALFQAIKPLKDRLRVPLIITQHMPPTFTRMLAEHITTHTGVPCVEGEDGMILERGKAYVAPGGFHMLFEQSGSDTVIRLNDGPMENFCKPAVDPMLRSAFKIYGRKIAIAILTGMGGDGAKACRELVDGGCFLVAQDKKTSVVWGMPGAVAEAGVCHSILPISEIGNKLLSVLGS